MNFSNLFEMQGMLFSLMILGAILKKKDMIKAGGKELLTDLVINLTLPCSILRSFQMEFNKEILTSCLIIFVVAIGIQIGCYLLSWILYPGASKDQKKILQYATICSNAGILGNPIAEGIFGALGLLYASVYLIPQRTFMWSVGITYFTESPNKKALVKKVVTHPCIIAVLIGMALMIGQIKIPGFLGVTVHQIANANTSLSMLLIGTILGNINLKTMFNKWTCYYSFIRLFFIPALVYGACKLLALDWLVTGVAVVLAGMPAASVTAILSAKYDGDEVFATKCVVSSTLLSMVTIPLWCILLNYLK